MQTIGSYEAKTRLPELLRQVERGERFTITRRGLPIARIVGVEESVDDRRSVIERLKA
ncbi:MAG: type II toxin-antitoxin system prevent-host-death family antitoxin, partial [Gammaproteobacteria bacterium]|nr:type II toxin-antitoxin system prevent-host-death family antitoxin [Gammaproteobacteria bacterium]